MATQRRRGRPRKVIPGYEWLGDLPDHLKDGQAERLQEQDRLIESLEEMRQEVITKFGGFGVPHELAYVLNDAQDPEMPDTQREKIFTAVQEARKLIAQGKQTGSDAVKELASKDRGRRLKDHIEMIKRLRALGRSELQIARRLKELTGISISTAQRWLKKI